MDLGKHVYVRVACVCVALSRCVPVGRFLRFSLSGTLFSRSRSTLSLSQGLFISPHSGGPCPDAPWEAPLDEGSTGNCAWVHMTTKGQPSGAQGANVVGARGAPEAPLALPCLERAGCLVAVHRAVFAASVARPHEH